jgi:hypothetical protein
MGLLRFVLVLACAREQVQLTSNEVADYYACATDCYKYTNNTWKLATCMAPCPRPAALSAALAKCKRKCDESFSRGPCLTECMVERGRACEAICFARPDIQSYTNCLRSCRYSA